MLSNAKRLAAGAATCGFQQGNTTQVPLAQHFANHIFLALRIPPMFFSLMYTAAGTRQKVVRRCTVLQRSRGGHASSRRIRGAPGASSRRRSLKSIPDQRQRAPRRWRPSEAALAPKPAAAIPAKSAGPAAKFQAAQASGAPDAEGAARKVPRRRAEEEAVQPQQVLPIASRPRPVAPKQVPQAPRQPQAQQKNTPLQPHAQQKKTPMQPQAQQPRLSLAQRPRDLQGHRKAEAAGKAQASAPRSSRPFAWPPVHEPPPTANRTRPIPRPSTAPWYAASTSLAIHHPLAQPASKLSHRKTGSTKAKGVRRDSTIFFQATTSWSSAWAEP